MAATKKATKKAEPASADPVLSTDALDEEIVWPEGTHPALSPGETHHSVERLTYKDNPDKPDPSTVAQIVEIPEDWS